jgi:hypothetical protein
MPMFPRRSAPYLFAFVLSGFMTLVVSGVATLIALGPVAGIAMVWMGAWITAWVIAFPALILIRPLVHRLTEWLTT